MCLDQVGGQPVDGSLSVPEIARQVGIGAGGRIVTGAELDHLGDADLDALLARDEEIVFARASPAAKLRIWRARREVRRRAEADPVLAEFVSSSREETP